MTKRIRSFRAGDEEYTEWVYQAAVQKITFGEWVRRKLNKDLFDDVPSVPVEAPVLASLAEDKKKEPCTHRLPPGTYCKTCERIKK